MKEQRLLPVFMTKEHLYTTLAEIAARVNAGDSFEGHISWEMPWDDDDVQGFRVRAGYRVGNLQGQGGMRFIGEWLEVTRPDQLLSCTECHHPLKVIETCDGCGAPKTARCPKCYPDVPQT